MSSPTEDRIRRDEDRANRLLEFVKGELREMYIGARMDFTVSLFLYLKPELEVLMKDKRIDPIG